MEVYVLVRSGFMEVVEVTGVFLREEEAEMVKQKLEKKYVMTSWHIIKTRIGDVNSEHWTDL